MAKKKKNRKQLNLPAVLSGKQAASAHQLIDLIHQINPSGMDYSTAETQRCYAQKAALQNRLIEQFEDLLTFRQEDAQSPVISIYFEGRDACHGLLDSLSVDNRALIRRFLDQQQDSQAPVPSTRKTKNKPSKKTQPISNNPEQKNADDLIACAQSAVRQYDYVAAQQWYLSAFTQTPRTIETTLATFRFLVDAYGDYEAVLSLAQQLSPQERLQLEVRILVATAAARMALPSLAEQWLEKVSHPNVGDVYQLLCNSAIAQKDLAQAVHFLQKSAVNDLPSADRLQLEAQVAALRQACRKPVEDQILQLFDSGQLTAAKAQAQACLDEWSQSPIARKVLREIEARTRLDLIKHKQQQAQSAYAQQQFQAALQYCHEALALGCDAQTLDPLLTLAGDKIKQLANAEQQEKTQQLLNNTDKKAGLLAYLACHESGQCTLKKNVQTRSLLAWLDQVVLRQAKIKPEHAVNAVLALQQAKLILASSPAQAMLLLAPHEKYLDHLSDVIKIKEKVLQAQQASVNKKAQQTLQQTTELLANNAIEAAKICLTGLNGKVLNAQNKQQIAQLKAQIRRVDMQCHLKNQYQQLCDREDFLQAAPVLDDLIKRSAQQDRALWLSEQQTLERRLKKQWHRQVLAKPDVAEKVLWSLDFFNCFGGPNYWVLPECEGIVVAQAQAQRLILSVISMDLSDVTHCMSLRTPESMAVIDVMVEQNSVWVVADNGCVLMLDRRTWAIVSWVDLRQAVAASSGDIEHVRFSGVSDYCWLESSMDDRFILAVFDLKQRRLTKTIKADYHPVVLKRGLTPLYFVRALESGLPAVYRENGKQQLVCTHLPNITIYLATMHPDGRQTIILYSLDEEDFDAESEAVFFLRVGVLTEQYRLSGNYCIEGSSHEYPYALVVDELKRQLYVIRNEGRKKILHHLALSHDAITEIDTWEMPMHTISIQAAAMQTAQLITWNGGDHFQIGSPLPTEKVVPANTFIETKIKSEICYYGNPIAGGRSYDDMLDSLQDDMPTWIEKQQQQARNNPDDLAALVLALHDRQHTTTAREVLAWALTVHPKNSNLIAIRMNRDFLDHDQATLDFIAGLDLTLYPEDARHMCHVLGHCYWQQNEEQKAQQIWRQGLNYPGACPLEEILALRKPFSTPIKAHEWNAGQSWARQLQARIIMADEYLEANALDKAYAILSHPLIFQAGEMQSSARLAKVLLLLDGYEYEKAQLFCKLVDMDAAEDLMGKTLNLTRQLDALSIQDIVRQAQEWIDRCL